MGKEGLEKLDPGYLRSSFFASALFHNFQPVILFHVLLKVSQISFEQRLFFNPQRFQLS